MKVAALRGAAALAGLLAAASAFAQGLVREKPEVYRSFPVIPKYRAFLAPEVDLSPRFPPPGAQGHQSSCVAWAVGYAVRSYYEYNRREWDLADQRHLFSPAYVYNRLHSGIGGDPQCHAGTRIDEALSLLQREGISSMAEFPYDPADCSRLPDAGTVQEARSFRIDEWRAFNPGSDNALDDIKGQLQLGNPVVFGMGVPDSFLRLHGAEIFDDFSTPGDMDHAMVLVGYSETRQAFKLMNSWGAGWGDQGFGWISYRAFHALVDQAYVVRMKSQPVPIALVTQPPSPSPAVQPAPPPPPPVAVIQAPPAPPPETAPPPPAPAAKPPGGAQLAALVASRSSGYLCAHVEAAEQPDGGVAARGFVASDEDRDRLGRELEALGAGPQLYLDLAVQPWPLCEVRLSFAAPLAQPRGLQVGLAGHHDELEPLRLVQGARVVIEVDTPDFPSYLYVTYVDHAGNAAHLYRSPAGPEHLLLPRTHLVLGADAGGPSFAIGPPFGQEMVVAIASDSPIVDATLPLLQTERQYLTAFRAAYLASSGAPGHRIAARVLTLNTAAAQQQAAP